MNTIILASKSPSRKRLLQKLGLPFEVIVSNFIEDMTLPLPASELALHLSIGKASSLAHQYPDHIIIAADTFVVYKDSFIGKPKDLADAKRILTMLSGVTHTILTGLTVMKGDKKISKVVSTYVKMKDVDEQTLDEYVNSGEPLEKAGAYALQGKGAMLVESFDGDYFNIMGLPLKDLAEILNKEFEVPAYISDSINSEDSMASYNY